MVSFFLWLFLKDSKKCKWTLRQSMIAEIVNLCLWSVTIWLYGITAETGFVCLLLSALLVLSVVDAKTQEIPGVINQFILLLAVWHTALHAGQRFTYIFGFFCISSILALVYWLRRGHGIGGGDIKLMAAAGMFLGWERSLWAFLTAGIAACLIYVPWLNRRKAGTEFAFGPFLAIGIIMTVWFSDSPVI